MSREKEVSYRWEAHDLPDSFRLRRLLNSIRAAALEPGWTGDVIVVRDINRERWLWGFTLKKGKERRMATGHAPDRESAQRAAENALWPSKKPPGEEVRANSTPTAKSADGADEGYTGDWG